MATIGCTEFSVRADSATADTVNTDTGSEAVSFRVTDGAGTVLFFDVVETNPVPSTVSPVLDSDTLHSYTTPPAFNPITFEVLALPGGPLLEEVVFCTFVGECEGLPSPPALAVPGVSKIGLLAMATALLILGAAVLKR